MKEIQLTKGAFSIVDDEDFEYLKDITWQFTGRYAQTGIKVKGKTKHFLMHRMIMKASKDIQVDHINGNTLDNRKENLRLVTKYENAQNRGPRKSNELGYKGVVLTKNKQRYRAQLNVGQNNVYLGTYDTPEQAAIIYNLEAIKRFGIYARLNEVKQCLHSK